MDATSTKIKALIDLIAFRQERFGVVANIFTCESTEEAVNQLLTQASEDNQLLESSIESDLKKGLGSLTYEDIPSFATLTRTEYARLFLGPREVLAPLHESAYLSGTSRMFTAETLAVRKFYEYYGYTMKAKNSEPDDSIGAELEFLHNICSRAISILEDPSDQEAGEKLARLLEAQKIFKEQHLSRWVHEFIGRVIKNDRSGYYVVWAKYLSGVVDEDESLLAECEQLIVEIGTAINSPVLTSLA